jgi:tetratricopeptide (TPR) repeat protein
VDAFTAPLGGWTTPIEASRRILHPLAGSRSPTDTVQSSSSWFDGNVPDGSNNPFGFANSAQQPLEDNPFRQPPLPSDLQQSHTLELPDVPYYFSRADLDVLKLKELRALCVHRGVAKSGSKLKLRRTLMTWVTQERLKFIAAAGTSKDHMLNFLADRASTKRDDFEVVERDDEEDEDDSVSSHHALSLMDISPQLQQPSQEEVRQSLNRNFYSQSAQYTNLQVQQLYIDAKHADQNGEVHQSIHLLQTLLKINPTDGRVIRRLARLATQLGKHHEALYILQEGTTRNPSNAHLWHGLAMMYVSKSDGEQARQYFEKALECDPTLPNAYHAYAKLEQSQGNVRKAASLLNRALRMTSPLLPSLSTTGEDETTTKKKSSSHRLWHALAQLYREAAMYPQAIRSIEKGLEVSTPWGKSFLLFERAQVALNQAALAGETPSAGEASQMQCDEFLDQARDYFRQAIEAQDGKHAQGWLALAQMEESIGNMQGAKRVYEEAANMYEYEIVAKRKNKKKKYRNESLGDHSWYSVYDHWVNVDLEPLRQDHRLTDHKQKAGLVANVCVAYSRMCRVFRGDARVLTKYATFLQSHRPWDVESIGSLLQAACNHSSPSTGNAETFRLLAEHQSKTVGNHHKARHTYYTAFKRLSSESSSSSENLGLAKLLHSWAKFELESGKHENTERNTERALQLLDKALCLIPSRGMMTQPDKIDTEIRRGPANSQRSDKFRYSLPKVRILHTIAQAEMTPVRARFRRAEHCISLALNELDQIVEATSQEKETQEELEPLKSELWDLWSEVAEDRERSSIAANLSKPGADEVVVGSKKINHC